MGQSLTFSEIMMLVVGLGTEDVFNVPLSEPGALIKECATQSNNHITPKMGDL